MQTFLSKIGLSARFLLDLHTNYIAPVHNLRTSWLPMSPRSAEPSLRYNTAGFTGRQLSAVMRFFGIVSAVIIESYTHRETVTPPTPDELWGKNGKKKMKKILLVQFLLSRDIGCKYKDHPGRIEGDLNDENQEKQIPVNLARKLVEENLQKSQVDVNLNMHVLKDVLIAFHDLQRLVYCKKQPSNDRLASAVAFFWISICASTK